ncbi:Phytochrome-like protein cph2 [Planktothrix tepida]|uniref:histidine kinase n=1 Tax=Planktothrix tepida PCC 9214 TaxID=671072 RepID=A0A1J1LQ89_9CYAN|nr:diguanylate cyclase [Planktothrix tepida]CAD5961182.1 Phytochrome-like protein cph2 [Planktothrix tepida]CUR34749.1 Regulatory components of sensory transduction system [Planktothrix tepida PCC 9214]
MNPELSPPMKGNILLVDDLPENLQLLSDLLIQLGYTVRSVTSGRMALKTVRFKQPDVIFLDVKMPEMDGYQVCEALKADENFRNIPVIFISALNDVFDKVKAFQAGGVDYITKPFQVEEVVARLESQLTIQRQKQLLEAEIIKRQEAEEILYQSRALLSSILNSSLDGIAALQAVREPETGMIKDFRCLVVNPVLAKVFERTRDEMMGKIILKKLLNRIQPELFYRFVKIVETGESLEQDIYYPFGESYWYHFVAVKLGDGFSITIRDITSRKKAELALQEANQKLYQLANLDSLTQVANRRCFDACLQKEWEALEKQQRPLTLIMFDLDSFKAYNDHYGHLAGDDCLFKIAQAVYQCTRHLDLRRSVDLVARYGGEEFVILLSNANLQVGINVAKRIQRMISHLAIPHQRSGVKEFVTVSLGIASLIPSATVQPDYLIQLADQALYNAKQQGRDCYCIALN